ncbi:unnamed protein product [Nesidiocoris tenuis]|uniref:Uncharacterized protein n=1 Tax=Nesidiocoris tenuis TaxID=355587 RepID=A0A6H5HJ36_9HEMI|nr:unnamed protein product [Nesidiocoris tenuis]
MAEGKDEHHRTRIIGGKIIREELPHDLPAGAQIKQQRESSTILADEQSRTSSGSKYSTSQETVQKFKIVDGKCVFVESTRFLGITSPDNE